MTPRVSEAHVQPFRFGQVALGLEDAKIVHAHLIPQLADNHALIFGQVQFGLQLDLSSGDAPMLAPALVFDYDVCMNSPRMSSITSPIPNFVGVKGFADVRSRFIEAARLILLGHCLDYCNGRYRWSVTTVELYLHHGTEWPDPTAHGVRFPKTAATRQLESGTWYVHRAMYPSPDPAGTRGFGLGPNRSGIDITAGSEDGKIFAGILIAGIGDKDGSATALKQIIRADAQDRMRETKWSQIEKEAIARINGTRVESGPLKLVPRKMTDGPLWIGARKGLPENLDERFKGSLLRLTTREKSSSPMQRLGRRGYSSSGTGAR
ncbi:hypothetical protein IVA93_36750 [Bradyrhizobium sp. 155]|uniref:hypothetical protein n=1 Tax=unclassified Bradyrhizobium TaxID=2631580 RepID=UPI001FFFE048|nr:MULTISPECIES: hypothetical protein [unclassified Bradyrhizobium]UPK11621.1 hypothetical protein IVA93_36750 [Bradyrhizobium sp. 155]UPK19525.1 hypothetical protein IVA73_36995 [Bradyrhizobium sp. 131]